METEAYPGWGSRGQPAKGGIIPFADLPLAGSPHLPVVQGEGFMAMHMASELYPCNLSNENCIAYPC